MKKKLLLNRETLRALENKALLDVDGGTWATFHTCTANETDNCDTVQHITCQT